MLLILFNTSNILINCFNTVSCPITMTSCRRRTRTSSFIAIKQPRMGRNLTLHIYSLSLWCSQYINTILLTWWGKKIQTFQSLKTNNLTTHEKNLISTLTRQSCTRMKWTLCTLLLDFFKIIIILTVSCPVIAFGMKLVVFLHHATVIAS